MQSVLIKKLFQYYYKNESKRLNTLSKPFRWINKGFMKDICTYYEKEEEFLWNDFRIENLRYMYIMGIDIIRMKETKSSSQLK